MFKKSSTYLALLFFLGGISIIILANSFKNESYAIFNYDFNPISNIQRNIINSFRVKEEKDKKEEKVSIKLSFIGDSELASFKGEKYSGNFQDLLDTHDYNYPFKNVIDIFKDDDYTIANGENVLTDNNLEPSPKDYTPAYWYYTKAKYAYVYKESSIDVVSVMNNHSDDYGYQGYLDTKEALKKADVICGAEDPVILEKDGVKIGIIFSNLFHDFQGTEINNKIKTLKDKVNYVVVYYHGGAEYLFSPTEDIKQHAHSFIDNGADLVLGTHPHVLEPIETYKDKKIVYSLGGFLFGGTTTVLNRTIIYQVNLDYYLEDKNLVVTDNIIPCYLYSSNEGYERWLPGVIKNQDEKQKVLDFMNGKRERPD